MTRPAVIFSCMLFALAAQAQSGDQQLRAKADALFEEAHYTEAFPLYSQLVSLAPADRVLNYRFGTCMLFGSADKEQAIGHLKFATADPGIEPQAWYWLGRAYHLNYRFKEAQTAYQRFLGTGDHKAIAAWPVETLMKQCRNGEKLLSSLKDIAVHSKVEVVDAEFFRFYDLGDIGGKIVVLPEELRSSIDKKKKERALVYLPAGGGPIYFSSYGRDGGTGKDIYRTELLPDGTFAAPQKLAGYVNTDQDEDFAFMHPDGRTFYFCSKGHNSMGGYDVFKASYDRGLDAFGRPENMDFAVNTPDDDMFYMTDGEQKQACFASGRDSHQGMLHVYRVATAQLPVVITVFKGTYASSIDPGDRKAHIVVQDALTSERVADVRTDLNGSYVLSVPRAGRYRYLVECGPSGASHGGMLEVPKSDGPRAYRQELILDRKGDFEQLTIRNYFDEPLGEDLIALALDEIKRRAHLDVTGDLPVSETPAEEPPTGDVMTRAGFTGDIDKAKAVQLAEEDARELDAQAADLQAQSEEAYSIAMEATTIAEQASTHAAQLVEQASTATDEEERNRLMTEGARERQRARGANLRARAAINTGDALQAASLTTRQKAATAAKLSTDLARTVASGNDEASLPALRSLKERMDEKSRPDLVDEPGEVVHRALVEHEEEVKRAMAAANAKRDDENDLTDRVLRLKREREGTNARGKREELDREIAELEQQLGYLREETRTAFNKVAGMEKQTAALRGQASLTSYLANASDHGPGTPLTSEQSGQLAQRINTADVRTASLAIDERYDAQVSMDQVSMEQRTFDWDLASAAQATGTERSATQTIDQRTGGDAERAQARTTAIQQSATQGHTTTDVAVPQVPISSDGEEAITRTEDQSGSTPPVSATIAASAAASPEDGREGATGNSTSDDFLLENERAELQQLLAAERDPAGQDSLRARIAQIDAQLKEDVPTEAADLTEADLDPVDADLTRPVVVFTDATEDDAIIEEVFADYTADRTRLERVPDADERASGLNGLELMLADSLRAEMQRQVAILQLSPQQAEVVLPRVDRLRKMRQAHIQRGDSVLAARQQELAVNAPTIAREANTSERAMTQRAGGVDPINGHFIVVDRYAQNVFASKIEHRSTAKGMDEAIAFRDADVARIEDLTQRIDSMQAEVNGMPETREAERKQKKIDALMDERLIAQTDLGQRSAFLMKEEWRTANDSLDQVAALTSKRGLSPDEPLLLQAGEYRAEAEAGYDRAAQMRKRADRIDDIVERDSLYRNAYRTELEALLAMDRAITVQNYLAGDQHQRGETLAYEEVARRVLHISGEVEGTELAGVSTTSTNNSEASSMESTTAVQADAGSAGSDDGTGERVTGASSVPVPTQEGTGTSADPTSGTATAAVPTAPVGSPSSTAATSEAETQAMLAAIEQRLGNKDRVPAHLYERFLSSDPTSTGLTVSDPTLDPHLLAIRAESGALNAADLERRSQEAADRAILFADSATTARKQDRERLEAMAVRERALSDSLHQASLLESDLARSNRSLSQDNEAARLFRERMLKFYYLTPEQQSLVEMDGDASRFFQMRTQALEQYQASDDAAGSAKSSREVAQVLHEQIRQTERDAAQGKMPADEAEQRVEVLNARAIALEERADSLENVSARLRGAAGINENQASVLLQALPAGRSSELMALEMGARRTETLLAEARDQAGRPLAPAQNARVTTSSTPAATPPRVDNSAAVPERSQGMQAAEPLTARPASPLLERPAAFVAPAVLTEDIFTLYSGAERREEAIPMDAALPGGIVFKVQIGAFRHAVPEEAFTDMSPVMGEQVGNGLTRYTAGLFKGFEQAQSAKDKVRDRGYRDAFIVAYRDGKRIPLGEAMRETAASVRPTTTAAPGAVAVAEPVRPTRTVPPTTVIERPVPTPIVVPGEDNASILAGYPGSAQEIINAFVPAAQATDYYNVPGAAPAIQVESIQGLFFTVQVGVYSKPVPLDRIFNITPLNSERTESNKVRYTTGRFGDMEGARVRKDQTVGLGVKDAFVTAYLNGKRIPVREASVLLEKFGPDILAKP